MIIKARKAKKQGGLTLIESLVVVGILLGIIAIALTLYGTIRDKLNVKNESENISVMFSSITDLFSDEGTTDLNNKVAVESGVVPKKMNITTGNKIYNSWSGEVTIAGEGTNGFTIESKRVPSGDVCVSLVRNQRKVGWDAFSIGGSSTEYSALKTSTLAASCQSDADYVDILFTKSE